MFGFFSPSFCADPSFDFLLLYFSFDLPLACDLCSLLNLEPSDVPSDFLLLAALAPSLVCNSLLIPGMLWSR